MSEQQAAALRVATRTLNDLADVVEDDLPTLDQSNYDQVVEDVSATDTPFAERWADIKACVDDHFEHLSHDESLDRTIYDYVGVSGGHPPEKRELTPLLCSVAEPSHGDYGIPPTAVVHDQ
ncbi:hypothetical protein [Halococcus thailandensis]|uniref:Uncharacterized protein n=1 Tax=Halococcus thailandensis JCM 13552 TaxID=1227457 RepID=M0NE09_9EURY|nr:hypothetical protein [Halococcus thailandensis]EMA56217.1 hypothetical protein C451_03509 [Halococcus thailandensis JCM 13552]